jgi:hypothetical protein
MAMMRKVQDRFMRNLFDAMYRHADEAGDKVAVSDNKGIIHRGELLAKVIGLAADLGPQPGPIGILAPNGIDWSLRSSAARWQARSRCL